MNTNIKKIIASIICTVLVCSVAPGFYQAKATGNTEGQSAQTGQPAQTAQITESAKGSLDVAAATAYARKHWNDGSGNCATFCANVLKAGGYEIAGSNNRFRAYTQYDYLVNELGFRSYYLGDGKITRNADKIEEGDLVLWDKSFRLKGVTSDTVDINGSGGHIVYISVANGPLSKYCAHNSARLDTVLNTGNTYGLWLIKTSELAGNEKLDVSDITPVEYEIIVTGNIHMTPNGGLYINKDGTPVTTKRGDTVFIDKTCYAGGYLWGRIVNQNWDWIVISQDRVREVIKSPVIYQSVNNWTGDVRVIAAGNVRNSPNGLFCRELLIPGNIRSGPNGDLRGSAFTSVGRIVSIADTRYAGDWLWGRIDNNGWDWIALEKRDGTEKRYQFAITTVGDIYTISEQVVSGEWEWGRLSGTDNWIAIENLRTGELRCEKTD